MVRSCPADLLLELPSPDRLRSAYRCAAMVDDLLAPAEYVRIHEFTADWLPGVDLARSDDRQGAEVLVVLGSDGESALIKGFSTDPLVTDRSGLNLAAWLPVVPTRYHGLLRREEFDPECVLCVLWFSDGRWAGGSASDVLSKAELYLLLAVAGGVETFTAWAEDMYEQPIPAEIVERMMGGTFTRADARALNPGCDLALVTRELERMGVGWRG